MKYESFIQGVCAILVFSQINIIIIHLAIQADLSNK